MKKYSYQPHFDWQATSEDLNAEDNLIELMDLIHKWGPILKDAHHRKREVTKRLSHADPETRREAEAIYIHLYGKRN